MASFGAQPVASLAVGFIGQALGAMTAFRLNGAMMIVGMMLLPLARRGLWEWEVGIPVREEAQRRQATAEAPAPEAAPAP